MSVACWMAMLVLVQAVRTTHCATETIETPFTPQDSLALWCARGLAQQNLCLFDETGD